MRVFILGAGKPATGVEPSLLAKVYRGNTALDWHISSLASISSVEEIHVMSGYLSSELIRKYPHLAFSFVPGWAEGDILKTFFHAPFRGEAFLVIYGDTIFRRETFDRLVNCGSDIGYCIDSTWTSRYPSRTEADIEVAEVVQIRDSTRNVTVAEFCGLVFFSREVAEHLLTKRESYIGSNLVDLIQHLESSGFSAEAFDVEGQWAEFNSRDDVARFVLGTKSETLRRLESVVRLSQIGSQLTFTYGIWKKHPEKVLHDIGEMFPQNPVIFRSSALSEDTLATSNAGKFESVPNVNSKDRIAVTNAISQVIESYGHDRSPDDQILVQEYLSNVEICGVVLTCGLETGGPYYRINFEDSPETTAAVTGGLQKARTIYVHRAKTALLTKVEPRLRPIVGAIKELERLLDYEKIDVEFAIDKHDVVHIFQIRPIAVRHGDFTLGSATLGDNLKAAADRFELLQSPGSALLGDRAIFTNMSDWNPAEIIGVKPRPFAFSLYRELICDDIWAQQRWEYGYRDVRPHNLLLGMMGQPYIDVRASLNSFIPATMPAVAAERIVNAYLCTLEVRPELQDKIEFEVAFTSWTPSMLERASARLSPFGVTAEDLSLLDMALKDITKRAFRRLEHDISPVLILRQSIDSLMQTDLPIIEKIFSLIDLCKSCGTLPFAHAARAGFIASEFLLELTRQKILSEERKNEFLRSIKTTVSDIDWDKRQCLEGHVTLHDLTEKYGHLRPGTYEITSPAYWEAPDVFFNLDGLDRLPSDESEFDFSSEEALRIASTASALDSALSFDEFIEFLRSSLQAREQVKFEFTRALSKILDLSILLGEELGMSREDVSFLRLEHLEQLRMGLVEADHIFVFSKVGRADYMATTIAELPCVLKDHLDFYCFEQAHSIPNYVTLRSVRAEKALVSSETISQELTGKIAVITNADPGFDWIFSAGIVGLITKYGGANSHMAIRAAELGIPAAIGVGDTIFENVLGMRLIELDCANRSLRDSV